MMVNNGASAEPTGLGSAEAPEPPSRLRPTGAIPCAWQPIETAPKDGTPLLLLGPDGRHGIGFIEPRGYDDIQFLHTSAAWIGRERWTGGRVNVSLGGYTPLEATHWMPLPEPPHA